MTQRRVVILHLHAPVRAARMRSEDPVRWNPTSNGPEFWSLTRAADIVAVSEDPQTFSSHEGGVFLTPDTLAPLDFARNFSILKEYKPQIRWAVIFIVLVHGSMFFAWTQDAIAG